jgi:hypothetical protein
MFWIGVEYLHKKGNWQVKGETEQTLKQFGADPRNGQRDQGR